MISKKIMCLLLALLTVSLTACTAGDTPETETAGETITAETETEEETEPPRVYPGEEMDFGGVDFTVATPQWSVYTKYYFAEEETGDVTNDASFARQLLVEEALNVVIKSVSFLSLEDSAAAVLETVAAGEDVYQQSLNHCFVQNVAMATSNSLYDWNKLPNMYMEEDWWYSDLNEYLAIDGKLFFVTNDYMIQNPYIFYFNKEIIRDNDMEDPYQLVYEGKWTVDKQFEMGEAAIVDLNGDTVFDDKDQYGYLTSSDMMDNYMFAADLGIVVVGEDGLSLGLNNERMVSLSEKIYDYFQIPGAGMVNGSLQFASGQALFANGSVGGIINLRDVDFEFGLLPYPKFDEAQEKYISFDWGGMAATPITITNPEMVGAVNDRLAYESKDTTRQAYFDVLLSHKLSRDEDSVNILNIVFENVRYDIGMTYLASTNAGFNMLYALPLMIVHGNSKDFASYYAKNEKSALTQLNKIYEEIAKLD